MKNKEWIMSNWMEKYKNLITDTGEVIMNFDDFEKFGGSDSVYIKDLEVLIKNEWKDLSKAFDDKDVITNIIILNSLNHRMMKKEKEDID